MRRWRWRSRDATMSQGTSGVTRSRRRQAGSSPRAQEGNMTRCQLHLRLPVSRTTRICTLLFQATCIWPFVYGDHRKLVHDFILWAPCICLYKQRKCLEYIVRSHCIVNSDRKTSVQRCLLFTHLLFSHVYLQWNYVKFFKWEKLEHKLLRLQYRWTVFTELNKISPHITLSLCPFLVHSEWLGGKLVHFLLGNAWVLYKAKDSIRLIVPSFGNQGPRRTPLIPSDT
jgi:hypothetical protein